MDSFSILFDNNTFLRYNSIFKEVVFLLECLNVRKIEKLYDREQGCTCPILVELENGAKAILKYPGNPHGIIVLINEYIASCVAKIIELPCPNFGIAVVDGSTLISEELTHRELKEFLGTGFYTEYIRSAVKASASVLRQVENIKDGCKLILFDEIVKNSDRHASNVLVTATLKPRMFAIDHSHAFGDPEWIINDLSLGDIHSPYIWQENYHFYDMLIRAGASVLPSDLEETKQFIQANITEESLDRIIDTIPEVWASEVSEDQIKHAKVYILNRVNNLDAVNAMIIRERGV